MRDRKVPAVLAALTLLGAACSERGSREPDPGPRPAGFTLSRDQRQKLRTVVLATRSFRRSIVTTGTVGFDADQATQVLAPISGPVSRLLVSLGAQVKRGQALAEVASPDFAGCLGVSQGGGAREERAPHRRPGQAALRQRRHRPTRGGAGRDGRGQRRGRPRRRAAAAPVARRRRTAHHGHPGEPAAVAMGPAAHSLADRRRRRGEADHAGPAACRPAPRPASRWPISPRSG